MRSIYPDRILLSCFFFQIGIGETLLHSRSDTFRRIRPGISYEKDSKIVSTIAKSNLFSPGSRRNLHRTLFWERAKYHNISIVHLKSKGKAFSREEELEHLLEMMAMRSPRISASSMWWLLRRIVRPGFNLINRSQIARRAYGSTPAVGSSRMMVFASPTKALNASTIKQNECRWNEDVYMATESLRFMPPERVETSEFRFAVKPTSSNILQWKRSSSWWKLRFSLLFHHPFHFFALNLFQLGEE